MIEPTSPIAADKLNEYLAGNRRREQARRALLAERRIEARKAASRIASALREGFGATRIRLFGSVVEGSFHEGSDIDLVVEGIPANRFLAALAAAEDAAGGFAVDLVPLASARPWVDEALKRYGVDL